MTTPEQRDLFQQVTKKILDAQALEHAGRLAEAADAYEEVAELEEKIVAVFPMDDADGLIASRGMARARWRAARLRANEALEFEEDLPDEDEED